MQIETLTLLDDRKLHIMLKFVYGALFMNTGLIIDDDAAAAAAAAGGAAAAVTDMPHTIGPQHRQMIECTHMDYTCSASYYYNITTIYSNPLRGRFYNSLAVHASGVWHQVGD